MTVRVSLEDIAAGVFGESNTIKDSRQPQGQSNLGKLPPTEKLEFSVNRKTFHVNCPSGFVCLFNPHELYNAFFVTMFVFMIECQLVLIKAPEMSKP